MLSQRVDVLTIRAETVHKNTLLQKVNVLTLQAETVSICFRSGLTVAVADKAMVAVAVACCDSPSCVCCCSQPRCGHFWHMCRQGTIGLHTKSMCPQFGRKLSARVCFRGGASVAVADKVMVAVAAACSRSHSCICSSSRPRCRYCWRTSRRRNNRIAHVRTQASVH